MELLRNGASILKTRLFFRAHPLLFTISYMILYLTTFHILEKSVKPKFIIHCALDDIIPFNEYFVVPYLLWFIYVPIVTLYLMRNDTENFWHLAFMMFGGMTICVIIYILFPNGTNLREFVTDRNVFCRIVKFIYRVDTSTNVCPSIHVLNSLSAHSALSHSPAASRRFVISLSFVFAILVSVSTVMIDQHSIIDVLCAVVLFFLLEKISYRQKSEVLLKERI